MTYAMSDACRQQLLRMAVIPVALAFCAPAHAESALEWAASQGANAQEARLAHAPRHYAAHRWARRRRYARAPLDIRTPLERVAMAYVGRSRFTRYARAWCADAMNAWLHKAGYHGTGSGAAISFARYGRSARREEIGSIAVLRHHVGIVVGRTRRGPVLLSGNHGHRVGIGVYPAYRIIAYRAPV